MLCVVKGAAEYLTSSLLSETPILSLCSVPDEKMKNPQDSSNLTFDPYKQTEQTVIDVLLRKSETAKIDVRNILESDYEDVYLALRDIRRALPKIPIHFSTTHQMFDENGYLQTPDKPMLYNVLSQCDVIADCVKFRKYIDSNRGYLSYNIWIPLFCRGYVMLEGGKYTPPMPPWSDSAQWVLARDADGSNLDVPEAIRHTQEQIRDMQQDQFVISAAPSSVLQFTRRLRKLYNNDGYCLSVKEHTPESKCMCEEFRLMESGTCRCGLYKKHRRIKYSEPKTPSTITQINRVLDETKEVL